MMAESVTNNVTLVPHGGGEYDLTFHQNGSDIFLLSDDITGSLQVCHNIDTLVARFQSFKVTHHNYFFLLILC